MVRSPYGVPGNHPAPVGAVGMPICIGASVPRWAPPEAMANDLRSRDAYRPQSIRLGMGADPMLCAA